jgi:hypothetical protein
LAGLRKYPPDLDEVWFSDLVDFLGGVTVEEQITALKVLLYDGAEPMADASGNLEMQSKAIHEALFLEFMNGAAPATPGAGKVRLYSKADKKAYYKDEDGLETGPLGAGGGGGDMYKSTYDTDVDGIVDKAENVDDGGGNSSTAAQVKSAVTASHTRSHAITSTSDHTSSATAGKMLKADSNGLPAEATNTDSDVSDAVSKKHTRSHSITSTSDHTSTSTAGKIQKANADGLPVDGTNTDAEVADAVTKKHTQNTDTGPAANTTTVGMAEMATATETTAGTDTTRTVTPDGLAGSDFGKRAIKVKVTDDATALTTGDGKATIRIPSPLNGMNLVGVETHVFTASSSGLPTVTIYNLTDSVEMMTVGTTIDVSEYDSSTAATGPTIDTAHDDVATGDVLEVNVDVAGTGTKGLEVDLIFQLP